MPDADLVGVVSALHGPDLRTSTDFDPLLGLSPFGLVAESQPAQRWSSTVDLLIGTNTEKGNAAQRSLRIRLPPASGVARAGRLTRPGRSSGTVGHGDAHGLGPLRHDRRSRMTAPGHGGHIRRFGGDAPAGRRATGNGRAPRVRR
ncbi:hypothetical protein AB0H42_01990 [Nocardia sp. NPDC050799]|uniref:hypothetical protein n=1 Tax=Nocardia sp. NPDC050799 TaxID=3154842 RepID=UPI003410F80B